MKWSIVERDAKKLCRLPLNAQASRKYTAPILPFGRSMRAAPSDAFGTLLDVYSVQTAADRLFPGHGARLAQTWRDRAYRVHARSNAARALCAVFAYDARCARRTGRQRPSAAPHATGRTLADAAVFPLSRLH
ncbi:MAG: hypothetical protein ACK4V1_10335 [Burkholderiaceae bacterium]